MAGTSISLPTELQVKLERVAYDEHKSRSEVVQDALVVHFATKNITDEPIPKEPTTKARRAQ